MALEITREEQIKWWTWWKNHIAGLEKGNVVSKEDLNALRLFVSNPESIGYDHSNNGQIRPGNLGQWDIFYEMKGWGIAHPIALMLSGLSEIEVRTEAEKMEMKDLGFDPDSPAEVTEFHRRSKMSPKECDAEIKRLEALLVEV